MSESADRCVVVPLRVVRDGYRTLRTARRPDGVRVGLAFSTPAGLAAAMGPGVPGDTMSLGVLRELLAAVGVTIVQLDPALVVQAAPRQSAAGQGWVSSR